MGLPVTHGDPHRRHAGPQAPAPEAAPPDILLTTPEQLALLIAPRDARASSRICATSCSTSCIRWSPRSAAHLLSLGLARLRTLRARPADDRPVGDGLRAGRAAPLAGGQNPPGDMAELITVPGGAKPDITMLDSARARALGGPHRRATRSPRSTRRSSAHRTTLLFVNTRSQAEMLFQRAVAHQRGQPADRAASRLARRRPAPPRREGDGDQQPARHRRHLDARPRHRLGRRRSRHPCRRAEGRQPAGAAHRPLQPPHGRAVARRSWCRPTASRCWSAAPRSRPVTSVRRTRRRCSPARSTCCRSTCWAAPAARRFVPTISTRRCAAPRPMPALDRADLRPRRRFRRDRRLCAAQPTSAMPASARPRTAGGASPIRASPSNTG